MNQTQILINEIGIKENEINDLKEKYNQEIKKERDNILKSKTKGINKSLYLHSFNFESSSCRTPQYLEFHRVFKKEIKDLLKPYCKNIEISSPNHFDFSGFFELNNNEIYYISLSDLRHSKDKILIRIAKDFKDYSGGSNNFIPFNEDFVKNLFKYLKIG